MSSRKKRAEKQENLMYVGPNIIGVVRHSTVFKDGVLPQKVRDCVEQVQMMQKLFVPLDDVPMVAKELKKEQSALRTIYSQVAKKFNK